MSTFRFEPSAWVPFRDMAAIERVRAIKRADIERHANPRFKIRVVPDADVPFVWITKLFHLIKTKMDAGEPCVLILGNPNSRQRQLARFINTFRVDCRRLTVFIMDEYADQDGNAAPEDWAPGFMHSIKRHFWSQIDPALRPPEKQIVGPNARNIADYGKMIADLGHADACFSGPGWTGHLAFIEPDAPEFDAPLDEWLRMGPRLVTLSPFTIAQNSLHGYFGMSGDLAAVPPKAYTIGPAEVVNARYRMDTNALAVAGTDVSWQRFMTRLIAHGPVTPRVPTSLHQLLETDFYISENAARDVAPRMDREY